jgi:DNA-binding GntR family transcriptional regulator
MQIMTSLFGRPNISEAVAGALRAMIVDGRLAAGERINEVHLAATMGVSRTPLREALSHLAAEGALRSTPRIGYFVAPLTLEEFEQIYPIRAILDPAALELAGIPNAARLDRLCALNDRLRKTRGIEKMIGLDDEWHLELVAGCGNPVLIGLINQFMWRTRRYEMALWREKRQVAISSDEHEKIMAALRAGNLERACQALRRNMQSGIEPIVAWLKARTDERSTRQEQPS